MDDAVTRVYSAALLNLAAEVEEPYHLTGKKLTAKAVSPICGSEVTVEIILKDNKVSEFGYEVEACALGRAVVAVMKRAVLGKTRAEIASAGEDLRKMLEECEAEKGASYAAALSGDWSGLRNLLPAREYTARHDAILLPFEAVEKAFISSSF